MKNLEIEINSVSDNDLLEMIPLFKEFELERNRIEGNLDILFDCKSQKFLSGETKYWLSRVNSQIVGYLEADVQENIYQIMEIYVLPEFRRNGIGTKLLLAGIKEAKKNNAFKLFYGLGVSFDERGDIRTQEEREQVAFYESVRFRYDEKRDGWMFDMQKATSQKLL